MLVVEEMKILLVCWYGGGIEDDIDEVEGDAPVPRKRKAARQPTAPRGFKRFNPGVTQIKEIRRAIRVEMIASMVCHLL